MSCLLGVDLGTTKTTAIAVDTASGRVVESATADSDGYMTSSEDRAKGRSEWDAAKLIDSGMQCLKSLTAMLGSRSADVAGIGITGQQHGSLMVDNDGRPLTPFVNWQDQRGNEPIPQSGESWVDEARSRLGTNTLRRTGCRPNTGFMAINLFWLCENNCLPQNSRATFIADLFAAKLTGGGIATDPSNAGGAGVFHVRDRKWDADAIETLGLSEDLFPEVREANEPVGHLQTTVAEAIGLPDGLPVALPIGDHQASFLGSVVDYRESVLLNVGTGAQIASFTESCDFEPPVELRPLPIHGNLHSNVGLTGGWSFQLFEQFVRQIGKEVLGMKSDEAVYGRLTELASTVAQNVDGLSCVPTFTGTRTDPGQRGSIDGISAQNFTPAHFSRAVIEGMARNYRDAWQQVAVLSSVNPVRLVGAGNGLRENSVLVTAVADAFGLPLRVTRYREEAAYGAALIGGVAGGLFDSIHDAARLISYENAS